MCAGLLTPHNGDRAGRGVWLGQETGQNIGFGWLGQETGQNIGFGRLGQETGQNIGFGWLGQETGQNAGRPARTR